MMGCCWLGGVCELYSTTHIGLVCLANKYTLECKVSKYIVVKYGWYRVAILLYMFIVCMCVVYNHDDDCGGGVRVYSYIDIQVRRVGMSIFMCRGCWGL